MTDAPLDPVLASRLETTPDGVRIRLKPAMRPMSLVNFLLLGMCGFALGAAAGAAVGLALAGDSPKPQVEATEGMFFGVPFGLAPVLAWWALEPIETIVQLDAIRLRIVARRRLWRRTVQIDRADLKDLRVEDGFLVLERTDGTETAIELPGRSERTARALDAFVSHYQERYGRQGTARDVPKALRELEERS